MLCQKEQERPLGEYILEKRDSFFSFKFLKFVYFEKEREKEKHQKWGGTEREGEIDRIPRFHTKHRA